MFLERTVSKPLARAFKTTRRRAAGSAFAVLVLTLVPPLADATVAEATVNATGGNGLITAIGDNFERGVPLEVKAEITNGSGQTTGVTDGDGEFSVVFALPDGYSGPVKVTATTKGRDAGADVVVPARPTTTTTATTALTVSKPTTTTARVQGAPTSALRAAGVSPSSMPVGDLAGWKQVFREDFTADLARGQWPGPYAAKWHSYDGFSDTMKKGQYSNDIISVDNGVMSLNLHTGSDGRPRVAAPVPNVTGTAYKGMTYGRYSVRFRADNLPGYKTAWLLWPDTDVWTSEINFPEGTLDGTINAFNHCPGAAAKNCSAFDTKQSYSSWHVATIEWTPQSVKFFLDGKLQGSSADVPHEPMHWVLQTETDERGNTAPNVSGRVQIDWVAAYAHN